MEIPKQHRHINGRFAPEAAVPTRTRLMRWTSARKAPRTESGSRQLQARWPQLSSRREFCLSLCSLSIALRIHRRGGPGPAAKLLQVFEDPIPLAPEREADDLADVGASSILIVDFRHRA
jgi:hypothetical protein